MLHELLVMDLFASNFLFLISDKMRYLNKISLVI